MELAQVDIKKVFPPAQKASYATLGELISTFLPKILIFAGVIFFLMTVVAGVGVIAGAGREDPHAQEKAKSFFTNALIGLLIIFTAYWIVQLISFVTYNSLSKLIQ